MRLKLYSKYLFANHPGVEASRAKGLAASIAYHTAEMNNAQEYVDGTHMLLLWRAADPQELEFWKKQVVLHKAEIDKLSKPRCGVCGRYWDERSTVYCAHRHRAAVE